MSLATATRLPLAGLAAALLFCAGPAPAQEKPMAERIVDAMEGVFGANAGMRRGHARGFCASGEFIANGAAAPVTKASTLAAGARSPVVARFSMAGGNPNAPENAPAPRGMALSLTAPNGDVHEFVLLSAPVFTVGTPQSFLDFLTVVRPDPVTRQQNQAAIAAAAQTHPDWVPLAAYLRATPPSASYATAPYFGVHTFQFINAAGQRQPARWTFEPVAGRVGLTPEERQARGPAFLEPELRARIANGPLEWRVLLQFPEAGDELNSPVVAWPAERRTLEVGTLRITALPGAESCNGHMFNPVLLPDGIEPSEDPILNIRTEAYAVSLTRRSNP
jgi:catalase